MKNIFLILIVMLLISCNNSDENKSREVELKKQISDLKNQNKILKDSLDDYEENFLRSQILIGIPDDIVLTVGKKNNVVMLFQTFNVKIPKYEIFKIEGEKRIKIGTNNKTRFDYEFIPKSIDDNKIDLIVKIPFNNETIEIPAGLWVPLKE
jgi:hypothetical protein